MSYGSGSKFRTNRCVFAGNGGLTSVVSQDIPTESWTRAGSSYNVPFRGPSKKKKNRVQYSVTKEPYRYARKVRIANPAYPKTSKKKYNYIVFWETRYRLKKKIIKPSPEISNSDLLVNSFNYSSSKVFCIGGPTIHIVPHPKGSYPEGWHRNVSGDTSYLPYFPTGWGTGSPYVYRPTSYPASNLVMAHKATIDRLSASATASIYAKAKDQYVNVQNFLGELNSTKSSIAEAVSRIAKTILLLRKGRFKQAASTMLPTNSKELANDVLLYKFGIAPLISDIDGALQTLAQNAKDVFCVVKSVRSEKIRTSSSGLVSSSILSRTETLSIETDITVKAVLKFRIDVPSIQKLSQLGFTNPVTTMWELTPWSFVIDWLIPIGDYLDTLDTQIMLQPVSFHTTAFIRQKVVCTAKNGGIAGSGAYRTITSDSDSAWIVENVACSRLPSNLPPPPLPRLQNPFSLSRIVSALALLRQLGS